MERREQLTLFLTVLLLGGAVSSVAGAAGAVTRGATGDEASATDAGERQRTLGTTALPATDNTIRIDHEYRLTPSEPGRIGVTWTFDIPDNVVELRTRVPASVENVQLDGFVRESGELVWREDDQPTRTPTVRFRLPVNESAVGGPASRAVTAGSDGLRFMDVGEWALVARPPGASITGGSYYGDKEPAVERTHSAASSGIVGDALLYLGPYEMTTRSAHGQQFRLVVPDAATVGEEKAAIFETVTAASDTLRVGDRDPTVTMFAAPASAPWGVAGLQTGDSAFYTVANQSVDTADNTWLHEYVHTRQDFRTTTATKWFTEASADYYAALLTLQQERIRFAAFQRSLAVSERRYGDVVLADPSTWHDLANYEKGALAAGQLDRRIRLASDGQATLQPVFRAMNERGSQVTQSAFLQSVADAGNRSVRETAREYTETTTVPEMWSQASHRAAFGALPAQFTYGFPPVGSDRLRVRGPYRNATATAEGLVVGETLVAEVRITNVGGETGTYNLTVTRNGSRITTEAGRLRPGESTLETVRATFGETGTYRLTTATDHLTVGVFEPAAVQVTDLRLGRTEVTGSGSVDVTAVATNPGPKPATGVVTIRRGDTTVLERRVYLDGNERTELTTTVRLAEAGTVEFTAGNESATVTVTEPATAEKKADEPAGAGPGASGPGFGVAGALVAVLLLAYRIE